MKYIKRPLNKFVILTYIDSLIKINKKFFNKDYHYRIMLPFTSLFDIAITEEQYKKLLEEREIFKDYPLRFREEKIEVIKIYK